MKQLLLNWVAVIGKAMMISMALSVVAVAAPATSTPANSAGIDFNHMTTGFPLAGGHATAACETCHVGGVFKGTPRNCDGCHALGKRVVATPKSNNHIFTDAPCESCHFNTSTFLGARFNHGTAQPEQCRNCHNSRIALGKPASHNSGRKATDSCDRCHRTSAFLPASWNHVGVAPGTCTTCHNGSAAIGKPGSHTTVAKGTYQCDECHSYIGWTPARYKHNTSAPCSSCHNGSIAIGKPGSHGPATVKGMNECSDCHTNQGWFPAAYKHTGAGTCSSCHDGIKAVGKNAGHVSTTSECNQCHFSTTTWAGALGGMPSNHIPFNAGTQCSSCHVGGSVVTGATLHARVSTTCKTCHLSGTSYLGNMDKKGIGHEGMGSGDDCSQSGCHKPLGSRGTAYINWD